MTTGLGTETRLGSMGIVIPAHNEAGFISRTLRTLAEQHGDEDFEIVVVENGSTDLTAAEVSAFAAAAPVRVTLLRLEQPSAIAARIHGMNHLLSRERPPRYLVSADADTLYPPGWLDALRASLSAGADMVAAAGYMDPALWRRCPSLAARYVERIGTIFIDPETTAELGVDERRCLFTRQVYEAFGRPVCAPGFAITTDSYRRLGGFHRDYYDEHRFREILIAGLPLMFRAELSAMRIQQVRSPWWLTSPRRLVSEPGLQMGRILQDTSMLAHRGVSPEAYTALDESADKIDYHDLLLNCVRDYLLIPCLLRPWLIHRHADYFGVLAPELTRIINGWRSAHVTPEPRHLFDVAAMLTDRSGDSILSEFTAFRSVPTGAM